MCVAAEKPPVHWVPGLFDDCFMLAYFGCLVAGFFSQFSIICANQVERVANQVEPVAGQVEPVANHVEPVAGQVEPVAWQVEPVANQVEQDTLERTELSQITVVAQRANREVLPVQRMTGEVLQKMSLFSVADAIRYFSGAQIKDYGGAGGLKTVNVRSMGSHHVGIFYDGLEIGNAQNGVVDLGRFSLENMETVSLYNGQKSAIFQTAKDFASSSAVYFTSREPRFVGDKRHNFNVGMKGGSMGMVNPSFLWEHKLGNNVSLSVNTEFLYTSGRYKFTYTNRFGYDTTAYRQNGDVRTFRAEVGLFGKVKEGDWRAKVYFYDSERGYPGAVVREEPGKFKHADRQWDDSFFVQGYLRRSVGKRYSFQINGKYAYDYLHYLADPNVDVTAMYVNNKYRQHELYTSLAHLFNISPALNISLANDFQWNKLFADVKDFVYPQRFTLLTALAASLKVGGLSLQGSLLYSYVKDKTEGRGTNAGDKNNISPSVVLSWRPFIEHNLNFRAFYKRAHRMPTFNDLYYTEIGNKYLAPERTTQYDVGLFWSITRGEGWFKSFSLQADAYYNTVTDKIVAMPTSSQFRWSMMNIGRVKIKGLEASGNLVSRWGNVDCSLRLSYTYQDARDYTDPQSEWYKGLIAYIPLHSGTAVVTLNYKEWQLHYSFIYTGEKFDSSANIQSNMLDSWTTHDIALSKEFGIAGNLLRTTLELNNITNTQYEVVRCYPMPGLNFKLKVNYLF